MMADRQALLISLVGIPYVPRGRTRAGADCWGVCLMGARELFGLELPEYFYSEVEILAHAQQHIHRETSGLPHWTPIEQAQPGAVHIFRIKGFEVHCGLDIGGGDFLHSLEGRASCIERLRDGAWSHRRTGTFAWTP